MVRIELSPLCFISRTASTASPATKVEFSHASGSVSVLEKTTLDMPRQCIGTRLAVLGGNLRT